MEAVTIDGVEYIRASDLAKRHRYTADYVGQLCRAGKVDAHLVGRAWYVYPPSLEEHKSLRYATLREGKKERSLAEKMPKSRLNVEPAVSKKTLQSLRLRGGAGDAHFEKHITWKPAAYEDDQAALLPELGENKVGERRDESSDMSADFLPVVNLDNNLGRKENLDKPSDIGTSSDIADTPKPLSKTKSHKVAAPAVDRRRSDLRKFPEVGSPYTPRKVRTLRAPFLALAAAMALFVVLTTAVSVDTFKPLVGEEHVYSLRFELSTLTDLITILFVSR
jgi:hypothetical protein